MHGSGRPDEVQRQAERNVTEGKPGDEAATKVGASEMPNTVRGSQGRASAAPTLRSTHQPDAGWHGPTLEAILQARLLV